MKYLAHIADDGREQTIANTYGEQRNWLPDLPRPLVRKRMATSPGCCMTLESTLSAFKDACTMVRRWIMQLPVREKPFPGTGTCLPRWPLPDTTAAFRTPGIRTTRPMNQLCSGV